MWLQHSLCNLLIHSELFVELVHWCTPGLVNSLVSTALEEHTVVFMLLLVLDASYLHSISCGRKRDWSIFSPSKNWRWIMELFVWQRCTHTVPSLAYMGDLSFFISFQVLFLPCNNYTSTFIYCLNSLFPVGRGKKFQVLVLFCLNISNAAGKFCQPFFRGAAKWNCQKLIVCFKTWLCPLGSWKVWECKYKSLKPNLKITDLII